MDNIEHHLKSQNDIDKFLKSGFKNYCQSSLNPIELAAKSIEKTLLATKIDPLLIDYVLYCSEYNPDLNSHKTLHLECARLGLDNAYPICVAFTGCGNVAAGIQLAESLLNSNRSNNILVVASDFTAIESRRFVPPSIALMSDGASSCIISKHRPEKQSTLFVTHGTMLHQQHKLASLDPVADFIKYNMDSFKEHKIAAQRFYTACKISPNDVKSLITQNLGLSSLDIFCSEFDIPVEKNFRSNLPRIGHVGSADNFINLCDYATQNKIRSGDLFMLLATGPYTWGLSLFKAV